MGLEGRTREAGSKAGKKNAETQSAPRVRKSEGQESGEATPTPGVFCKCAF